MSKKHYVEYFTDGLWKNNQIVVAVLGICSALAVTIKVSVALVMGASVIFVTAFSSLLVSLVRNYTPDSVRMIAQLVIISTFVIIVDQLLKAYSFEMSQTLSVFVGLIITNCIVMGRAESMAKENPPIPAFLDGAGAASGYAIVLFIVGALREVFGFGSFLGYTIIPASFYASESFPSGYMNFNIMALAPSAFFILGSMIWIYNIVNEKRGQ